MTSAVANQQEIQAKGCEAIDTKKLSATIISPAKEMFHRQRAALIS